MWFDKVSEIEMFGNFFIICEGVFYPNYEFRIDKIRIFDNYDISYQRYHEMLSRCSGPKILGYYYVTKLEHDIYLSMLESNCDAFEMRKHLFYK